MALFTGHTITPDSALGGKEIKRSIRFNRNDSTQVEKTNLGTSPTNRKISTQSFWFKRSDISDTGMLTMGYGGSGGSAHGFACGRFVSSGRLSVEDQVGNSLNWQIVPSRYFRDTTTWYHIVVAIDTTQSTSSNRVKIYINGVQETDLATSSYPSQNYENQANYSNVRVGAWDGNGYYNGYNGYIAELHSIDGQALDASYFGAFSQTGIWIPKDYTGTYGDNGFYLDFSDNSSTSNIGLDRSGNGHHFNNVSGIQVSAGTGNDSLEDTPTNNFCTLSTEDQYQTTQQNGCLTVTQAADPARVRGTMIMKPNTGKWYYEMTVGSGSSYTFGMKSTLRLGSGTSGNEGRYTYYGHNGYKQDPDSSASYGATYGAGDTVAILYDSDAGHVYFYKNNTSQGLAFTGVNTTDYQPYVYLDNYGTTPNVHFNFGQRPFAYTPPAGAKGLSSKNMATPVAAGVVEPNRFFDTITYTGDGASEHPITGLGFKPDMIWVKARNYDYTNHGLTDGVKFDPSYPTNRTMLYPNLTNAETGGGNYFAMKTSTGKEPFFEGGFTLNNNTSGNNNGNTFVAWAWKAGGNTTSSLPFMIDDVGYATAAAAGLDGGTKNPTGASVSTKAGFSIVTYVASNGTNDTIYHGLNKAPEVLIAKDRDNSRDWGFYYSVNGTNTNWQKLNSTDTEGSNDSGQTLGGVSGSYMYLHEDYFQPAHGSYANGGDDGADKMVAYMWHSVPGFSKIGVYHGNGSSDGQFVNCGFRPAWVLIKRTSGSGQAWLLMDNKRSPSNPVTKTSSPQSNRSEDLDTGGIPTDFLGTGFKCRGSGGDFNDSSYKYFFMAFAEQPSSTPFGIDANAR